VKLERFAIEGDFLSPDLLHLTTIQPVQITAAEHYLTLANRAPKFDQTENGEREGALAGAALTYQAHDFTFIDVERHIVKDLGPARVINRQSKAK
jgi:hypothetical protein